MDAIVDAAVPARGTQDAESSRAAVREALSDLLDQFPGADLTALSDEQRMFVIERFVAEDVFNRFCLDMQKTLMEKAPDTQTALARRQQIRLFIVEVVADSFRKVRGSGTPVQTARIAAITNAALKETFAVFEEYLQ